MNVFEHRQRLVDDYSSYTRSFIKTPRRAEDFILKCPEFVIVDEVHGCTLTGGVGRGRQQRFDLLCRITADPCRHVLLVTATPHSGNEDAFRSLLSLLDVEFANLPPDLDRAERDAIRRKLARHPVQRRRSDIRRYKSQGMSRGKSQGRSLRSYAG